ncbi:enolase C-terminal domain-like protein [Mangrovibrevibacter kandeliae]|uniref:enolase C-terminal domain-like protein n=1 Tax=Mangrovibrevibacter kandeliae TaxID=2968473 RepID=UPI002117EAA6|nr:enolase C-terminal domain-like protein [Aurantimonas sp. CSK15Z-1]MCQ8783489.1 enolase [Aurantimonas sp. CSK15Z-1]
MRAPAIRIEAIDLFEREMTFLHPFRFGDVTVRSAPQAFVRVVISVDGAGRASGATAEMMMPRWFDRRPERSPAETVDDLRRSLVSARDAYLAAEGADTAFGHRVRFETTAVPTPGTAELVTSYGPSVIDKAILDALFRAFGTNARDGITGNLAGLDARLTPDLDEVGIHAVLSGRAPPAAVAVRWTVGMVDDLDALDHSLAESGIRHLKIKLGGDPEADIERLAAIGRRLGDRAIDGVTLDANEQYRPDPLARFVEALQSRDDLGFARRRFLYLEQPFPRDLTLATPLGSVAEAVPVIIDESDGRFDAFPRAVGLGYRGVSSKSCKGLYKALLNGARARRLSAEAGQPGRFFVAGEDLTCQPGLAVQQDTALAALLGIAHVERNGHHYVDGFGPAPAAEADAMAAAHPDLYANGGEGWRLAVRGGVLPTASLLTAPGFASGAEPDFSAMRAI